MSSATVVACGLPTIACTTQTEEGSRPALNEAVRRCGNLEDPRQPAAEVGNDLSAPPKLNRRVEYDSLKRPDVTAGSAADAGGGQ